ncbi:unnamed protein product [Phytophthora lilii]|uniref:Unnamed protein product n=1 Tax=Phytophthora lilii TaxID=2077276 RepID=A0A9W6WV80_9STRA|nr:unnamed protein product [Phytophthora lilii]
MIDQLQYNHRDFKSTFFKVAPSWLPENTRSIISATHVLDGGVGSLGELQSFWTFGAKRSRLVDKMEKPNFTQLLIRECNEYVGGCSFQLTAWCTFSSKRQLCQTELV